MRSVKIDDACGQGLQLLEDAGYYFSPNVQPKDILQLPSFKARQDDVLIVTYPKSGTHWLWEVISMLSRDRREMLNETLNHLEYMPAHALDLLPSPRVLCSHLSYSRLPVDFLRQRCKIVVAVRNPRDVAVSYHQFVSNLKFWHYTGDWASFYPLFLGGNLPYNSWFEHTCEWFRVLREAKHNTHLVVFENLQQDFKAEVQRLADFLGVQVTDDQLTAVKRHTSFLSMKTNKPDVTIGLSKNGTSSIFRKGVVGDWENWFTADQKKKMDLEMDRWGLLDDPRFIYQIDVPAQNSLTSSA